MLKRHAPAKVNLFLRILAREESGFHQLETLFTSLDFGDTITLEKASSGVSLEIDGLPAGPLEENLVYRAAKAFLAAGGVEGGVEIRLKKRIPPGAGLGGGSSDAGTTLLALRTLFPGAVEQPRLLELAGNLGSDVPFFLSPSPLALAWGRGDRLLPLPSLPQAPVLLALPPVAVQTPHAYHLLSEARRGASHRASPRLFPMGALRSWEDIGLLATNDFEDVIFREHPLLREIRMALRESGSVFSLLSGSGSALFGLYGDPGTAGKAKHDLSAHFPDVRFILTSTGSSLAGPQETPGG